MKKSLLAILTVVVLFTTQEVFSQLAKVNFNGRINQSQLVVEGKVISKRSFWDNQHHNIYTANKVEVYKVFKGAITTTEVEIITPGGTVGYTRETVEPSLSLSVNEVGVFILKNNTINTNSVNGVALYEPYASVQGFVAYNIENNTATSVFDQFTSIENQLYTAIQNNTHSPYSEVRPFSTKLKTTNNKAASISNFTPTTATAGTATTITINGSGFGASAGTVRFSYASDGGATFIDGLATEIISWNDNQIVVEVNKDAGTGPIQVVGTSTATSATDLTVTYAQLNAVFDQGSGDESYQKRHVDRNGNGGYVWQMHTDFSASAANAAFVRSLDTWRCNTGVYWTLGADTTLDASNNDDVNIVRFDNGGELPNGVLGRCTSRWAGCGGATIEWYVEELDIVFDDGTNWNFSTGAPGGSEYDFESVSLHELGHGHQLGHVINTNDIMHYAISNGEQNRTPNANNLAGAGDVQSRSTGGAVCSQTVMTNYSCNSVPVAAFSAASTTVCNGSFTVFTDASTNTPTSWSWTFTPSTVTYINSTSSSSQNPEVQFDAAGTYQVQLTATNAHGSDDEIKAGYITVNNCATTQLRTSDCGLTLSSYNNYIMCDYLSGATEYEYEFVNVGLGYSETYVAGNPNYRFVYLQNVTGILDNTTYDVRVRARVNGVYTAYGSVCQVTTPAGLTTQLRTSDCGLTLSSYNNYIMCDYLSGATEYEYEFVNVGLGYNETYVAGNPNYRFVYLQNVTGILDNTTYDVRVRARVNGVYTAYGSVCQVTTPAGLTTQLRTSDCGLTLSSYNNYIMCDYLSGATEYEYEFVNVGLGYNETYVAGNPNYRFVYLQNVTGILDNTTYDVRVRARVNGVYTAYGSVCQITTPPAPASIAQYINNNYTPEYSEEFANESVLLMNIYPNPNEGESFGVLIEGAVPNAKIYVMDISGKTILYKDLNNENENMRISLAFDSKLSRGFYTVTLISGDQKVTKKLIVR